MLQSFFKNYDEIRTLPQRKGQEARLERIDIMTVNVLVHLLLSFFEGTKALEGDFTPTIHHVYQQYVKLKRCMIFQATDCPLLKFLKRRGFQPIDNKFEITPLHKLALFSKNDSFTFSRSKNVCDMEKTICPLPRLKFILNSIKNVHVPMTPQRVISATRGWKYFAKD